MHYDMAAQVPIPVVAYQKVASGLWLDGGFLWVLIVSSTNYNWLVITLLQYGRNTVNKQNTIFIDDDCGCSGPFFEPGWVGQPIAKLFVLAVKSLILEVIKHIEALG